MKLQTIARAAGAAYLLIIVTSLASMVVVDSKLTVESDAQATLRNIAEHQTLYRGGLAYEVLMFASVIFLAWALYVVLREVDERLAFLGMLWRVAEGTLGAAAVLLGLLISRLASGRSDLAVAMLDLRAGAYDLVLVFISLGTLVNAWLFFRARLIPRALSVLGLVSFAAMLAGSLANVVLVERGSWTMAVYTPGIVFEVLIGVWLLVRGVAQADNADGGVSEAGRSAW